MEQCFVFYIIFEVTRSRRHLLPDNDDVCQTVTTNQIFLKTAVKDSLKTYLPKHVAKKRHSSFQLYFDTAYGSINEIEGFMSRLLSD